LFVIDDALLLAVLGASRQSATQQFVAASARGDVFTTGSWYWRLARALSNPGQGALFRAFADLDDDRRPRVILGLASLPPEIGMLSLRQLVPVMAALPVQANLLTLEAVAAAVVLEASLAVTVESPVLSRVAAAAGVVVDVVRFDPAP